MNPVSTILVGVGATLVVDLWSIIRKRWLGVPLPDYAMVGRWFAHLARGRLRHERISASAPVRGERAVGWASHYLIGIGFAAFLFYTDTDWIHAPTLAPALLVGIGTVLAPFLIMQPGMGAGIAASRTPRPASARLQSLLTHAIFGIGLYAAGLLVCFIQ